MRRRKLSTDDLFSALNIPGIDPRNHILEGRISSDPDSIRIIDGCVFVDIELAGLDVEYDNGGTEIYPEATAKWMFLVDGSGGVFYPGLPKAGLCCVVLVQNGDPGLSIYAHGAPSQDHKLPSSVLADTGSMHLVAPAGGLIKIGSRGAESLKKAARIDDSVVVNSSTDSSFMTFLQAVITAWNAAAVSGGPLIVPAGSPTVVTAITGKVSTGSSRVLIGGASGT
jgi:hypothetical protein